MQASHMQVFIKPALVQLGRIRSMSTVDWLQNQPLLSPPLLSTGCFVNLCCVPWGSCANKDYYYYHPWKSAVRGRRRDWRRVACASPACACWRSRWRSACAAAHARRDDTSGVPRPATRAPRPVAPSPAGSDRPRTSRRRQADRSPATSHPRDHRPGDACADDTGAAAGAGHRVRCRRPLRARRFDGIWWASCRSLGESNTIVIRQLQIVQSQSLDGATQGTLWICSMHPTGSECPVFVLTNSHKWAQ